jgi:hypothetical protein
MEGEELSDTEEQHLEDTLEPPPHILLDTDSTSITMCTSSALAKH